MFASHTTDMCWHPKYIRSPSNPVGGERTTKILRVRTDNSLNKICEWPVDMKKIHSASLMRWRLMPVSEPRMKDGTGVLEISRKASPFTLLMDPCKTEL